MAYLDDGSYENEKSMNDDGVKDYFFMMIEKRFTKSLKTKNRKIY